jgi:hypothetical protein
MLKGTKALEIPMAYQAVDGVVAGNSETGWQKALVRNLTEQIASPPVSKNDRLADNDPLTTPDRSDAISIIQRVGGLSIGELDKTIQGLQQLRAFLASEEERMRREMAEYLKLTQSSMNSTKAMSEMIANFGSVLEDAGKRSNP